jgi:hypothetical protein
MECTNRSMYKDIARKIREIPQERNCTSYEWEELVKKMCDSDDAGLRDIGARELEILRLKYPQCPVVRNS